MIKVHTWKVSHRGLSKVPIHKDSRLAETIVVTRKKSWWELLSTLNKLELDVSTVYDQKHIPKIEYLGESFADDEPDKS